MLLEIVNSSPASNTTKELDSFCPGTACVVVTAIKTSLETAWDPCKIIAAYVG